MEVACPLFWLVISLLLACLCFLGGKITRAHFEHNVYQGQGRTKECTRKKGRERWEERVLSKEEERDEWGGREANNNNNTSQ